MITIIQYEKKYQPDFKRLNLEWLEKYNVCEQYDLDVLNDPEKKVIGPGGRIFLAIADEKVIGTAGLANEGEGNYELIKMAVDPGMRGKGIGKLLLERCLEEAASLQAKRVFLFSNSQLTTALSMYEKFGFKHVPVTDTQLVTADVKMELLCTT
jgi:putative acetyltransferase